MTWHFTSHTRLAWHLCRPQSAWTIARLVGVLLVAWPSTPAVASAKTRVQSWYLMMPTSLLGWPFANDEAPLSRWNFVDTFDSAGHCQAKRLLLLGEASKYADAAAQALEDWRTRRFIRPDLLEPAMRHATMSRAQCIAVATHALPRSHPPGC